MRSCGLIRTEGASRHGVFGDGRSCSHSATVSGVTVRCRAGVRPNAARHSAWAAWSSGASANHRASVRKSADRSERPDRRSLNAATVSMSCVMAVTAAPRSSRACDGWRESAETNQSRRPRHLLRQTFSESATAAS